MSRIVLWGLGLEYNRYVDKLKLLEFEDEVSIIGVTAKDIPPYNIIDGWKLYKTCNVLELDFDYILVLSETKFNEIVEDIIKLGVCRNKILRCNILDIPYFSWKKYIDIYESNISIISDSCVGGTIYNTLGMECISPFKNMFVDTKSLCEKYSCLKNFLSKTPQFYSWGRDANANNKYPIGLLEGVELHFNHDNTFEDAIKKWNRRKEKVNYENLFLQVYAEKREEVEAFLNTMGTSRKGCCFVDSKLREYCQSDLVYELKIMPGQTKAWESRISSVSNKKNSYSFSLLDMLNGEKKLRLLE